jgi:hypothetical protein
MRHNTDEKEVDVTKSDRAEKNPITKPQHEHETTPPLPHHACYIHSSLLQRGILRKSGGTNFNQFNEVYAR